MRNITNVRAAGSLVLIELLNPKEALGTALHISETAKLEAPQAHILDIGPGLDQGQFGFRVGDRILFSGMMTPVPKTDGDRQRGIIDAFAVKAVLEEASPVVGCCCS